MKKTNGELTVMVEDLKEHLSTKIENARMLLTDSMNRVETQTTKTNGRVTEVERRIYVMIGAITVIVTFVVPMAVYIWKTSQNLDERISQALQEKLNQYEVEVK